MEIKIYQINQDRDNENLAFRTLPPNRNIPSEIYDKVYESEVDCSNLEDVYRMFNIEHPADFRGRSLSVSDIVEVVESNRITPGYYYCDTYGFKPIDFEPDKAHEIKGDTIRVVLLEPERTARIADIPATLEGMQKVVGGYIKATYPYEEQVCIVCNEEGKLQGLPLNRAIREEDTITELSYGDLKTLFRETEEARIGKHAVGYIVFTEDSFTKPYSEESRTYVISSDNKAFIPNMGGYSIFASCLDGTDPCVRLDHYMTAEHGGEDGWKIERCYIKEPGGQILDVIAGPCFICSCAGENFGSLSQEQAERYAEKFKYPEYFYMLNGKIECYPIKPERGQER